MTGGADPRGVRRSLYGRRHGRPLRPGRRVLLERLLPQVAVAVPPPPARIDPARLFPNPPRDLWLEIGFGGGEHLAWQAARNPAVGFLGAEYFVNGVASLLRLIERDDLTNIRLYQGDGRDLLAALPAGVLGRVFILFPDPWPKARHHKRRIVQSATLDLLATAMRDGAELRLATDHPEYLVWMLERCCSHPAFAWRACRAADWRTRPPDWPATRYEAKAIDAGHLPTYLSFERRSRSDCS